MRIYDSFEKPQRDRDHESASRIVGEILLELREKCRVGATTADLDRIAKTYP